MERQEVKSSTIKSIGYDHEAKAMEVEFQHGGVYRYEEVTPEEHKAFVEAESAGGHFHANIRGKKKGVKL